MRVSTTLMNVEMSKFDMDKMKVHIVSEMNAKGKLYLQAEKDLEERQMSYEERSLPPQLRGLYVLG